MAPYFLKNLVPRRETRAHARPLLTAVATITWVQWAMFFSGYVILFPWKTHDLLLTGDFRLLAWTCDALDFFSVSLSVTSLGTEFGKTSSQIVKCLLALYRALLNITICTKTTAITLTLLFRSLGAVGIVSLSLSHSLTSH